MAELKTYIRTFDLDERIRSQLTFSDSSKIRMYTDFVRTGIRLRGAFNKWSRKIEFPLGTDITVRLPSWSPQAVKGWLAFQEISRKPDGTSISWRVSDGTDDYWWSGAAWIIATGATDWNTEIDVSANISTFPYTQRTIQFIARLVTTDKYSTPVLLSFNLAISAQFDYWEDLILRSLVPRLRSDFQFIVDYAADMSTTSDNFNIRDGSTDFTSEKNWEIVGVDAVYDNDNDPNHNTDLLSSYDVNTGKVVLTTSLSIGTTVFMRMKIQPDIIVSFAHVDYIEVPRTPAVVIESMNIRGRQVVAFNEMVDMSAEKGLQLRKPFYANTVTLVCSLLVGSVRDSLRMISTSMSAVLASGNSGQLPCLLSTTALDERVTMLYDFTGKYNPRPNFSHLMASTFGIIIKDFYVWTSDAIETPIVKEFKFSPIIDADVDGPEVIGDTGERLNAGVIPMVYKKPDSEDG